MLDGFSLNRLFIRCLFPIAALLSIALFSGCATTGATALSRGLSPLQKTPSRAKAKKAKHPAPAPAPAATAAVSHPDSTALAGADSTLSDSTGSNTVFQNPDSLIEAAKKQCADSNYAAADSNLRHAVKAIEAIDADNGDNEEWLPATQYLQEIVSIYAEKMPPAFSIPDEITVAAFQSQMMLSIDSMKFLPSDSLSIAALVCRKDLSYDIPMVWNDRVQRALFFYISHRSVTVDKWFQRAPYYLPMMRKIFEQSGLPQDLAYLPLIESGFNPMAYSYAHASGIWQFISSTGKAYSLRHNYWVDERRDPLKATHAAARYLGKLFRDFNDWHLALAAYNCGENGVARTIRRKGTRDFWKLPLPKQTKSYVPFYLAAVTIAKNPKCFNLVIPPIEPFSLDTVQLRECLNLSDIADGIGVPLDTIKKLNLHIVRWCTPPDSVVLYLPRGLKDTFVDFCAKLPEEKKARWCRYQVKQGDNINKVAAEFNITVECIAAINHLKKPVLEAGRCIFLPQPLASGVTTSSVAFIPPEQKEDEEFGEMTTYRVRPGDNLGKIARRFHVPLSRLFKLNRLSRSSKLKIGRVLVIRRAPALAADPVRAAGVKPDTTSRADTLSPGKQLVIIGPVDSTATPAAPLPDSSAKTGMATSPVIPVPPVPAVPAPAAPDAKSERSERSAQSADSADTAVAQPTNWSAAMADTSWRPSDTSSPATTGRMSDTALVSPPEPKTVPHHHIMKKGENLFRVSLAYNVKLKALLEANNFTEKSVVRPGDSILIPVTSR